METAIEASIRDWHGIAAPNPAARRLAAELADTIAAYAALRGPPPLDEPPASFSRSLARLADRMEQPRPAASDALAGIGLAGQRERLASGAITAAALLEQSLACIDRHDGALNAVLWQRRPEARAAAAAADRHRAAGAALPPLHGVPLAHKDLFGEPGRPETGGSDFWRHHVATVQATVLARLHRAGSYAFAGLNMAEFAQNPTGHNAAFGDCINPWNPAAIAGGSSSGSAVAVAAGYCAGSLGTDTGGSIRLPAACCGVTGLKPSWGLVSRAGVVPLCASLDCVGPIARTARDCAILLDAIAGPDPADPTTATSPPPGYEAALDGDLRGQRIGVPANWFLDDAVPEILAAFHAALAVLHEAGATLVPLHVPLLAEIVAYGGTMARVEAASLHAGWMRDQPGRYVPHVAARLYPGYAIPATYYVEAMQRRPSILEAFAAEVFGAVDALACPTMRSSTPSRAQTDIDSFVPGTERAFFAVGGNVRPFNYLGLPGLSLPCGFDAAGVPIGLHLAGRPFAEARLLRIADAYQRRAGPPALPFA